MTDRAHAVPPVAVMPTAGSAMSVAERLNAVSAIVNMGGRRNGFHAIYIPEDTIKPTVKL